MNESFSQLNSADAGCRGPASIRPVFDGRSQWCYELPGHTPDGLHFATVQGGRVEVPVTLLEGSHAATIFTAALDRQGYPRDRCSRNRISTQISQILNGLHVFRSTSVHSSTSRAPRCR